PPDVQGPGVVGGSVPDGVAGHVLALGGDEERYGDSKALGEVVRRPGIGKHGALDRDDGRDVSRLGGADLVGGGRGEPPIWPVPRRGGRTRARRGASRRESASPLRG